MYWSFNKSDAVIFILIGVCISLTVASGLIWLAPKITERKMVDVGGGESWPLSFVQTGITYRVWHTVDKDWPWGDGFPPDAEGVSGTWVGLPFVALHRRVEYPIYTASPASTGLYLHPGYWSPHEIHNDLHLYRPYWIGLLADTFFWGGIIWLIRCLWRTIIAHKRLRRGCCAYCGYDQSGLQKPECCPECGK